MSATLLFRTRIIYGERAFAELVLWRVSAPLAGSTHRFKYRLAYVVDGDCVLRFDNEAGKGEQLIADFNAAIERWNDENRHA